MSAPDAKVEEAGADGAVDLMLAMAPPSAGPPDSTVEEARQPAVGTGKRITLGEDLRALIRELVTTRRWFPSPGKSHGMNQKQQKKWATGETLVLLAANIPRFLQERMIRKLDSYTDDRFRQYVETPRESDEWCLAKHSYRLLISVFEKDDMGGWLFAKDCVLTREILEESLHTRITSKEAYRAVACFIIMTHVSYATISEGTHPALKTPDWHTWFRHVARDLRFGEQILSSVEQPATKTCEGLLDYASSRAILSFLCDGWAELRRLAEETLLIRRFAEGGTPEGACKLCTEDVALKRKMMREIVGGVFHEQLTPVCSYVCNRCGVRGHHISAHNASGGRNQ
eukprot:COSAG02_NODE_4904_length_4848_cov_23.116867_1_plen_342_part_00